MNAIPSFSTIDSTLRVPLSYDYLWKGLFIDLLLSLHTASFWLRMSDAELDACLARLRDWIVSEKNSDKYAIEWMCGAPGRPPNARAIRTALKAVVPLPISYWAACARVSGAALEREEPFDPIVAAIDEVPDADEHW